VRLDELDYELPAELIAQVPVEPRDASRLLVARGAGAGLELDDRRFGDLASLLAPGDVLVRNDTRVIPARAHFRKSTGGRIELLFLERQTAPAAADPPVEVWQVLARGRLRGGETLRSEAAPEAFAVVVDEALGDGRWQVRLAAGLQGPVAVLLARHGETPLPPYIRTALADPERYQTVYARLQGSAAAPTAGLHFTPGLDDVLRRAGVVVEHLTLHVGLATFKPVTAERLEDHPLHEEPFVVDRAVWRRIAAARAAGRRIVAVGTTMVRLLEELGGGASFAGSSLVDAPPAGAPPAGAFPVDAPPVDASQSSEPDAGLLEGRTGLFILPGHRFAVVDGLITNFHLPRTSLLALVMAFCGVDETRRIYAHAIARRYRFYSFGDAMLAWRAGQGGGPDAGGEEGAAATGAQGGT
jgi:S-adenosylmethionine:tRNA ribosyltransferase-isomerase